MNLGETVNADDLLMTNDELRIAIDYARAHSGRTEGSQIMFGKHLEDLLIIQRVRAAYIHARPGYKTE